MMLYYDGKPVFTSMGGGLAQVADIYSEEEQVVGTWIDGKPLYRRVFRNLIVDSVNKLTILATLPEVETYVMLDGWIENSVGEQGPINFWYSDAVYMATWFRNTDHTIRTIVGTTNYVNRPITVILTYTKTADQPGSPTLLNPGTSYSEEEQIVGTWIDGKPVYQRTFAFTFSGNTTLMEGVDQVISFEGRIRADSGDMFLLAESDSGGARAFSLIGGVLSYVNRKTGFDAYKDILVTVRYTKL